MLGKRDICGSSVCEYVLLGGLTISGTSEVKGEEKVLEEEYLLDGVLYINKEPSECMLFGLPLRSMLRGKPRCIFGFCTYGPVRSDFML